MDHMAKNWVGDAAHWAWYGRLDVLDLEGNSNNALERQFGIIKYCDLQRNAQSTIHKLVVTLITATVVRHMRQRAQRLVGRLQSEQQRQAASKKEWVAELASNVQAASGPGAPPGLVMVRTGSQSERRVSLGDLTCDFEYSGTQGSGGRAWCEC